MLILSQFILRLSFGMAAAMTLASPRQVTSGYYRNNLYVLLGLNVFASLLAGSLGGPSLGLWLCVAAAVFSYAGAVTWLYERARPGMALLVLVAATDLAAAWVGNASGAAESAGGPAANSVAHVLALLDPVSGGLLLGATMAAMLLGHWYLNAPGMPLAPLWRLIALLAAAVALRSVVCGVGLAWQVAESGWPASTDAMFLALRWIGGLLGTAVLAGMAWQTLKIPNTQSATGILYVAVITTFLGELAAGLLSGRSAYPL